LRKDSREIEIYFLSRFDPRFSSTFSSSSFSLSLSSVGCHDIICCFSSFSSFSQPASLSLCSSQLRAFIIQHSNEGVSHDNREGLEKKKEEVYTLSLSVTGGGGGKKKKKKWRKKDHFEARKLNKLSSPSAHSMANFGREDFRLLRVAG
jgi:hypothetical protein